MRQVRLAYAAIAVGVALVAGGAVGLFWPTISYEVANFLGFCDENVERAPLAVCFRDELDFDSLNSLYKELALSYDGALDREKLLEGAKHGLVAAVGDPYTVFMSRTEATEYRKQLSGDIGYGVGVEIGVRGGKVVVLRVIDDNPAARAGVKAGDILKKVGDKEVTGMTSAEAADLIRGANGSSVEITVERAGATKEFTLKREKINNPSVLLSYDGGIAVMRLSEAVEPEKWPVLVKYANEQPRRYAANEAGYYPHRKRRTAERRAIDYKLRV